MFIGGAQGYLSGGPRQEEILFYRGYGQTDVNQAAMEYYRYERVVEDIAVFTERILLAEERGEDRERYVSYVASNFLAGGPVEMAHRSQKASKAA